MVDWQGKTILVIGAARQGVAATRFLAAHGSQVILTDNRPKEHFADLIYELKNQPVKFAFGEHPLDLLEKVDYVCVSGGVPLESPLVLQARKMNIPLTNDAQLFLDLVPAKVIGITGSAGKTTTTTLVGEIAKLGAAQSNKVWVGGNIGNPLIEEVKKISSEDWVVMELSSFQLELMHISPTIAAVLNITPNHLDRHKTMRAYTSAKAKILNYQEPTDWAILNREEPGSYNLRSLVIGNVSTFGFNRPESGIMGTFLENDTIMYFDGNNSTPLIPINSIQLLGNHNLMNSLAACAVAFTAGFSSKAMQAGISSIKGIPHRLEFIRDYNGIRWYNDSIATAPERVIAAINTIPGPLVLLLGGRDKELPWKDLAALLLQRKPKVILFGEAGPMIKNELLAHENGQPIYPITLVDDLKNAVSEALSIAERNDSVLLSPGGTSYDAFLDFEERGNLFRELVEAI
ncbi:MAG: UDP-N-acetylmuramoyl-L-alanine--D-glutamate ligase [Pelolinea sp.]|nr:UDP-N-acetylmuramoyl-L-alanine--D-glutamate ligase [Pelolinea sp.]